MDVKAVILVGGETDSLGLTSAMAYCGDERCFEKVVKELPESISDVILAANPEQKDVDSLGYSVVFDSEVDGGPLVSILSVLKTLGSGRVLILAGDDTSLKHDHIERMLDYSDRLPRMTVVASDGGALQPMCLILPVGVCSEIESYLQKGGRSAKEWLLESIYMECELDGAFLGLS